MNNIEEKMRAVKMCVADFKRAGVDAVIESVNYDRINKVPLIRLSRDPGHVEGACVVRKKGKGKYRRRILTVQYLGCQLRWEAI